MSRDHDGKVLMSAWRAPGLGGAFHLLYHRGVRLPGMSRAPRYPRICVCGEQPDWLKKDTIERLFPQATYTRPLSGKPPAVPVDGPGGPMAFCSLPPN